MIKHISGNILDATENIIVQSVNHQGVMGAGLAKQIATKYPSILLDDCQYKILCKQSFEDIKLEGVPAYHEIKDNKWIASIFGQDKYGLDKQYTDYVALGNGLESVRLFALRRKYSIAIPSGIGCRLGGGDWDVVLNIIENCFKYSPELIVTIYKL